MVLECFPKMFINKINFQQNYWKTSVKMLIFNRAAGLEPAALLKTELLYKRFSKILLTFSVIKFHQNPSEISKKFILVVHFLSCRLEIFHRRFCWNIQSYKTVQPTTLLKTTEQQAEISLVITFKTVLEISWNRASSHHVGAILLNWVIWNLKVCNSL